MLDLADWLCRLRLHCGVDRRGSRNRQKTDNTERRTNTEKNLSGRHVASSAAAALPPPAAGPRPRSQQLRRGPGTPCVARAQVALLLRRLRDRATTSASAGVRGALGAVRRAAAAAGRATAAVGAPAKPRAPTRARRRRRGASRSECGRGDGERWRHPSRRPGDASVSDAGVSTNTTLGRREGRRFFVLQGVRRASADLARSSRPSESGEGDAVRAAQACCGLTSPGRKARLVLVQEQTQLLLAWRRENIGDGTGPEKMVVSQEQASVWAGASFFVRQPSARRHRTSPCGAPRRGATPPAAGRSRRCPADPHRAFVRHLE